MAKSGSKDAKSNCKKDARKIKFNRAKIMKLHSNHFHLNSLDKDKSIIIVPGTVPPREEDQIVIGGHHKHNHH